MRKTVTTVIALALAMVLCSGCAGGSLPWWHRLGYIAQETVAPGGVAVESKSGATTWVDKDSLDIVKGSMAVRTGGDKGNPVITQDTAKKIFRIALEGKIYTLPCDVRELIDDGWELTKSSASMAKETIKAGESTMLVGLQRKGDSATHVSVTLYNPGTKGASWDKTKVVGIKAHHDTPSHFANGLGTTFSTSATEVVDLYGHGSYGRQRTNASGAQTMSVSLEYLLQESDTSILKRYGTLAYEVNMTDNSLLSFQAELNCNKANPLAASLF